METFLLKVVKTVFKKELDLTNLVFVLPNQRAGIYLRKHYKNQILETKFFPEILTFDNLAEQLSGIYKSSAIELLFDFYKIYTKETPDNKTDTFEVFSNWAITVLNDFNEIDSYLVDPKAIFSSLKEINKLHNWNPNTELTKDYLIFFKNLEKYYHTFYKYLIAEKKGYQGLIFREAVKSLHSFIENTRHHFVFVGFNHLKTSESQILQELLVAGKASVYWNVPKNLLENKHPAGQFIRHYLSDWSYYKNNKIDWISTKSIDPDNIEIIGAPKNVGMIKYVGELIDASKDTDKTAIVLTDQNVLPISLNSLPKKIDTVNITMGFPLVYFPFSNLVKHIFEMHIHAISHGNTSYYYKTVLRILTHPIIQTHFNRVDRLVTNLTAKNSVTIHYADIKTSGESIIINDFEVLLKLFKPIKDNSIQVLLHKINSLIAVLKNKQQGFEKEVLYKHFKLNQKLLQLNDKYPYFENKVKDIVPVKAFFQLYKKIIALENLNFIGEPLQGLQIMGFLETQALDFKHLIITSMNEGTIPKGKKPKSFIPFDIRKHYKLLTYREEDAIMSYHFFRLLEASEKVTLLFNNQTDTFGSGEKSQFLTQLLWKHPEIRQKIINPKVKSQNLELQQINKTPAVIKRLKEIATKGFSPSSLATYLYNPITFYQQKILKIKELDSIEETVTDTTMGTVIHDTLEELYKPFVGKLLREKSLQKLIPAIPEQVKRAFKKTYKNGQFNQGKNRLIYEVIVNFVKRFISDEINTVKSGKIIRILSLEASLSHEVDFPKFNFPIQFVGKVDRIDEVNGVVRIIDYKSGKVESGQLRLDDFLKISTDYKYSKGLQVMLYAYLYSQQKSFDKEKKLQAGIISFKNLKSGFMPVNFAPPRSKLDICITTTHFEEFLKALENLLLEIFDTDIPFIESE